MFKQRHWRCLKSLLDVYVLWQGVRSREQWIGLDDSGRGLGLQTASWETLWVREGIHAQERQEGDQQGGTSRAFGHDAPLPGRGGRLKKALSDGLQRF